MALTKVSGGILDPGINVAGIVTATGFDGPFTGGSSSNINAGIITATGFDLNGNGDISGNLVIGGNLTANGDFTTLNTTLREVEILRVDANSSVSAGIITQTGSGHGLVLADDTTFKMAMNVGSGIATFRALNAGYSAHNGASGIFQQVDLNTAAVTFGNTISVNGATITTGNSSHRIRSAANDFAIESITSAYKGFRFLGNVPENTLVVSNVNSGSVGIGSAIPTVKLDVAGTIKTTNITSDSSNLSIENTADRVMIKSANRIDIADNFIRFQNRAQNATVLEAVAGASGYVKLFHNDSLTASVTSDALTVTGRTANSGMVEIASNQGANNNDRFRIHKTSAASRLTIQNYSTGSWVENIRFNSDGEVRIPTGSNSTSRLTFGGSINIYHDGNMKFENATGYLKLQSSNNLYIDGAELFFRNAGGTNRWKIDSSGHLLPGAVGSYNIGSTGAEIGNVFLADSKKVFLGSDQDVEIYHDGTHGYLKNTTGNLFINNTGTSYSYIDTNYFRIRNSSGSHMLEVNSAGANQGVQLFHAPGTAGNGVLKTTSTGIDVTGEVAASQDYPNFRPTLDLNFAATKKLDPKITYQRTGIASFIDEFGLVKIVSENAPRFDHDPTTRECKGLLIEESRTNIHPYSQDLSNWTAESGGSVTANTHISPAGDLTADSINGTQSGSSAYDTFGLTSGTTYTFSFFMKYVSGNQNILISIGDAALTRSNTTFNTSTGALVSNGGGTATVNDVVAFPNGWYRYSITRTATSSSSAFIDFNHTSSTASVVAVWGAQVEEGTFATSYIPTVDNTDITRGADVVDIDGEDFTDFYNQTESTIISSHTLLPNVPNAENVYVYQIQDASTNNVIRVVDKNSSYSNVATGLVLNGGSSQFHFNNTTDSYTKDKVLVALSVKQDDFAGCHNGGDLSLDNSGTLPTNFNALGIGRYPPTGGFELNGHIQRFIYYPKQLSDSQLKTLTS